MHQPARRFVCWSAVLARLAVASAWAKELETQTRARWDQSVAVLVHQSIALPADLGSRARLCAYQPKLCDCGPLLSLSQRRPSTDPETAVPAKSSDRRSRARLH